MLKRAYSLLTVKAVDDAKRQITGIATTPEPDRYGDIVESAGAEFTLPLPLLSQHNSAKPIGHVIAAKVSPAGIEVTAELVRPNAGDPQAWADRLNESWADIRSGLVRGLSIGFKPLEFSFMEDGGIRFMRWLWLELSSVTIPANADATIQTVKSIDLELRAAPGREQRAVKLIQPGPGVSGITTARIRGPVKLVTR